MSKRKTTAAVSPADELFEGMPEHVKAVYKNHKALRRQRDREAFAMRAISGVQAQSHTQP